MYIALMMMFVLTSFCWIFNFVFTFYLDKYIIYINTILIITTKRTSKKRKIKNMGCCLSCLSCDCVECCQRCFTGSYLWRTKAQRVFFVNKVNNNVETRSSGWLIFTGSWLFYYLDVEGFREWQSHYTYCLPRIQS